MMNVKFGLAAVSAAVVFGGAAYAEGSRLDTVLERGSLLCSGHNGSYLGFAEVDDNGNWKGLDIDLCRGLAAGLFGKSEGNLEIVPISWAQRWPALQSGDIDVVIKLSGWTQSRDTELNLAFSRPYFLAAWQMMAHAELGASSIPDLAGGSLCVLGGTSNERILSTYLQSNNIDAEIITYEKSEEMRESYFSQRCDGVFGIGPFLAVTLSQADDPAAHTILPDVLGVEPESIVVPEGDSDWLDVQNWMLASLWYAESVGINSSNVEEMKANPPSAAIASLLGSSPGYGTRLGLSDDWAFNMIKEVGNFGEIYDRNIGDGSPYNLPRGVNALLTDGGAFYPMVID